ncbi:dienelactone hydrolase family protein [Falsiroseomonas oryziterrae]|uniref:dienelactone hydrolase family protein n=1 Tax=Falsiroseomonas oryziterrae TaxID=2911368 RepID=UPI001F3B909A|nr:dienelactone hydrolase family protein [Roseomonas sp. NPKOSM-4]
MSALLLLGTTLLPARWAEARDATVRIAATAPHSGRDVQLFGEVYRPAGEGRFPAVVLKHGCGGWMGGARHALQQHAAFLRDNGFVVLNLDGFGPRGLGDGSACASVATLTEALRYRTQDAFDALRYLRSLDYVDSEQIFLMGQSNGGSVAMLAAAAGAARTFRAAEGGFRAVVAFYPWCGTLGSTRLSLEAPLLVLTGARDDWTPPDDCRRFTSSGAPVRVTVYGNAAHSFDLLSPPHRFLGKLVGYDADATQDSRQQMLAFFREHGARARVARAGASNPITRVSDRR